MKNHNTEYDRLRDEFPKVFNFLHTIERTPRITELFQELDEKTVKADSDVERIQIDVAQQGSE